MSAPVLTPQEIAQLKADKAVHDSFAATMQAAIPQKIARAAQLTVSDGAFKKFFNYYNDDIIGKYDNERKALDGQYISVPITEADIVGPANLDPSVRTTPTNPVTDIIRVPEFDGGPLITTPLNETQHIADQLVVENTLVNGYPSGSGFNPATAKTNSALTGSSTTLGVLDLINPLTIAVNDVFAVSSGSDVAIVKVTSVTDNLAGNPPFNFTYGIMVLVPPSGTIPTMSNLITFTGFTNGERASKTASNPDLQPLMNLLISELQLDLNNRKARLSEELVALAANQDPDGVATITTAIANANASNSFLTSYLIITDISDSGLASLDSETSTRSSQITARVAQIVAAYTGQTLDYYDQRYNMANNRGSTTRGTLRLRNATLLTIAQMGDFVTDAQAASAAITSIL